MKLSEPIRKKSILLFVLAELVLYIPILSAGGQTAQWCSYSSIVLCFLFSGLHLHRNRALITAGLACTVGADYCLVVCLPRQQLWGMLFFLCAQTMYALYLHRQHRGRWLLILRLALTAGAVAVAVAVLGTKTDLLALVSVCYYANLICNLVTAVAAGRKDALLAAGFALFLLCDTVIGLQEMSRGYLALDPDTLLYRVLFMAFPLAWFFYLPSQVCIALYSAMDKSSPHRAEE